MNLGCHNPRTAETSVSWQNGRRGKRARTQSWCELGLPVLVLLDQRAHDREEAFRLIVDLDVDVEEDVLVGRLHEEVERLAQQRNLLMRLLDGAQLVELAVIPHLGDRARPVHRAVCEKRTSVPTLLCISPSSRTDSRVMEGTANDHEGQLQLDRGKGQRWTYTISSSSVTCTSACRK